MGVPETAPPFPQNLDWSPEQRPIINGNSKDYMSRCPVVGLASRIEFALHRLEPPLSLVQSRDLGRIFATIQQLAVAAANVDWNMHHVDAAIIRAYQQGAGAKQSHAETEALRRVQGGFSTNRDLN